MAPVARVRLLLDSVPGGQNQQDSVRGQVGTVSALQATASLPHSSALVMLCGRGLSSK